MSTNKTIPFSLFTSFDVELFSAGKHFNLYEKMGAHELEHEGTKGVYFAVWAPNAKSIEVIGNFNHWDGSKHQLNCRWDSSGIWEGFIPGLSKSTLYKYKIYSNLQDEPLEKADPYGFMTEIPPKTASVVWDTYYEWKDEEWMKKRGKHNTLKAPVSIYEVHVGSWKKQIGKEGESLSYKELATSLVNYVKEMGFTHIEFLPLTEYPFFDSWGYQPTGFFAPTSRFGTPQELMYLIESCHKKDIGVIMDWVPSHFPGDIHGLYRFDGSSLYEHDDPRKGFHPDWKSYIFNYGRNEVRSFLISSAMYWLNRYHIDGIRVDAVASMLYLDYSRNEGEWIPNYFGGRENLEAISLLKELNAALYGAHPDIMTIAEESTAFPMVSRPVDMGGLGFMMKWMMGWMNDTLEYFKKDSIYRKFHQDSISFSLVYAFTENFVLPLSHDEVVHGKGSLLDRMPGNEWQRFANLRLLYAYMFMHPGCNLLFMGSEIAQASEWKNNKELEWYLLDFDNHKGVQNLVKSLNHFYKEQPALYDKAYEQDGFEWIDHSDNENSILSFIRKGHDPKDDLIVALNMTPNFHENYAIGCHQEGHWEEVFNSDKKEFWGRNKTKTKPYRTNKEGKHFKKCSLEITIPPLACVVLKKKS